MEGFKNNKIYENPRNADILILAGDIHVGAKNVYNELLLAKKYHEHVVYINGNHELYKGNSFSIFYPELQQLVSDGPPGIHYLCNSQVNINGVNFLGTPLFTNFRGNPYHGELMKGLIRDFVWQSPQECFNRGLDAQAWLKYAYERTPGPKIIVTHWLPAVECISPKFATEVTLNRYFANDMGEWIKELSDVPYWFFGHTHDSVDITLGETRLIANPAGYRHRSGYYENPKFSESAIYEI